MRHALRGRGNMEHFSNRPCAAPGLVSYRYIGRYGPVMIGAKDTADALKEAARSIAGEPDPTRLQVWNEQARGYVNVVSFTPGQP